MNDIELKKVTLTFQTKTQKIPIFRDLNLSFSKGEFVTVYGPSGKGKSTLRILSPALYVQAPAA